MFGKKEDRLRELEEENKRFREEVERLKKEYEDLHRKHTDYLQRSMDLEQRAAVLNYEAHKLARDNETFQINIAGYKSEREQILRLLDEARQEIDRLKSRLKEKEGSPE